MKNRSEQVKESEKILIACLYIGGFILAFAIINALVEVLIK